MAKLFAVAVLDVAINSYNRPFFVPSLGLAHRSFADEVNRASADNPMFAHSKDFSLWHVGFYEEETGRLSALDNPERLCHAQDVLIPKE